MKAALLAVAFLLLLLPAAAPARTLDLPTLFEDVPSGVGNADGYSLGIAAARNCGGATACFVADFSAQRGEDPHYTRKVRLTGGRKGYFKPLTCGASCSPPVIEWVEDDERKRLRQMANSAIRHGAR